MVLSNKHQNHFFFVALDVSEEFVKLEEDFHYWSIGCKSFTLMKELSDRPSLIGFILAKEALSIDCKNVHVALLCQHKNQLNT